MAAFASDNDDDDDDEGVGSVSAACNALSLLALDVTTLADVTTIAARGALTSLAALSLNRASRARSWLLAARLYHPRAKPSAAGATILSFFASFGERNPEWAGSDEAAADAASAPSAAASAKLPRATMAPVYSSVEVFTPVVDRERKSANTKKKSFN